MSSLLARSGRERQRYEDNVRLVSGCIPYRLTKDDREEDNIDLEGRIEVLMLTSPNRTDFVFPKGGWEDDETVVQAACREAFEEAGVKGILKECPIGEWKFRSKSRQDLFSMEGSCKGYMFALEVTEELETWPEQEIRDRKWLTIKDAFELCRYEWMREALDRFLSVMVEEEIALAETSPTKDCPIMSSNCHVNPSNDQHSSLNGILPFSWQPKRLIKIDMNI
ncbi:hypothetical protein Tsubulata_050497 [Turnera subulata]|uniref:Nudix hydrolase domain-containing protein n=1 Tax=Turnera subulata TaxID=218843 RepID=A0A9Q0FUF1_9ROSI|nr:hypothetical protein Tsubulata_050497 [Turnera subulata]